MREVREFEPAVGPDMRALRCDHGLTDDCEVYFKTDMESKTQGKKVTLYSFRCFEHGGHGTHKVTRDL